MIANTAHKATDGPQLRGHSIDLRKITQVHGKESRHTKIICTLGPACWSVSTLEDLIDEGMNVARFNFSHGDHEGHAACLARLREAAKNKGVNVAVLLDTKGPEIRTGCFANGAKSIEVRRREARSASDYYYSFTNLNHHHHPLC